MKKILLVAALTLFSMLPSAIAVFDNLEASVELIVYDAESGQALYGGTGVVVTDTGHILTNEHVVADAASSPDDYFVWGCFTVAIDEYAQCGFFADVLAVDYERDLALLQIAGVNSPAVDDEYNIITSEEYLAEQGLLAYDRAYLPSGDDAHITTGDDIYTIGYPGISEGLARRDDGRVKNLITEEINGLDADAYFRSSLPLHPGNSGGGVFASDGQEVVGIANSIATSPLETSSYMIALPSVRDFLTDEGVAAGDVELTDYAACGKTKKSRVDDRWSFQTIPIHRNGKHFFLLFWKMNSADDRAALLQMDIETRGLKSSTGEEFNPIVTRNKFALYKYEPGQDYVFEVIASDESGEFAEVTFSCTSL